MSTSLSRAFLPAGSGHELAAAVTSEAIGSALLQIVAGAARAAASGGFAALTGSPSLVPFVIAAASYVALSSALRPASGGHLNPALSLAAALGGRLAAASFLAYAAAQLGGGVVGSMVSSLTVPGARLFRRAGAVGCLAPPSVAKRTCGSTNWWLLMAWEGVSSAAASLALLSHSSPAFVALALAAVGAAAAAAAPSLGDVVGNPVLALSPAVAFGCGWRAAPARLAGQVAGAAVAAAVAATVMPPLAARVVAVASPAAAAPAAAAPAAAATTPRQQGGGGRGRGGGRGGAATATATTPAEASAPPSEREPLLPTTTAPGL